MGSGMGDHTRQLSTDYVMYITRTGYPYSTLPLPIIYLVHITFTLQAILYIRSIY